MKCPIPLVAFMPLAASRSVQSLRKRFFFGKEPVLQVPNARL
jgi:hypothetical protein